MKALPTPTLLALPVADAPPPAGGATLPHKNSVRELVAISRWTSPGADYAVPAPLPQRRLAEGPRIAETPAVRLAGDRA